MVVHHIGEIVGGEAVGFNQDHIVQLRVGHFDDAVDLVLEAGGSFGRHILTDHKRLSGSQVRLYLFL